MNIADIKALVVVLAIASIIFWLAKPIALQFSSKEDFSRRRALWFLLTIIGFVSPNIWLYALIAFPLLWWASRKDTNPIALYLLMLHVIPPVPVIIPIIGNNGLFALDNYRLLSFCVLAPTALRLRATHDDSYHGGWSMMDALLLVFGILIVSLYTAPDLTSHAYIPDSATNQLRRAFLFVVDIYLVYWVVKRSSSNRRAIVETLATFCLASAIMAALATFEFLHHWLLYDGIISRWDANPHDAVYITHGSILRAEASSGHPLSLGYLLVVAFAFWLYLKTKITVKAARFAVIFLLWIGLLASYSRGPWLAGAASFFVFNAVGPHPLSRTAKAIGTACLLAVCVAFSPLGPQIYHAFHALGPNGTADPDLVYREQLAQRGWQLVLSHPFFGDRFPWPAMADLRQGEGIIDIVNTYLGVALGYGIVGLATFVGFILLALCKVYTRTRELARTDPDLALLGASLVAAMAATMLMIADTSFRQGAKVMFYVLAALAAGYCHLVKSQASTTSATLNRELSPCHDDRSAR